MLKATVLEHAVVASRPQQMYGWPGITRVKGSEILVAASERKHHVDPWGRAVVIRSLDSGRTWELPQEVYNSELCDAPSGIVTLPDGTVVLSGVTYAAFEEETYFRQEWQGRVDRITQKMRDELVGSWVLRSFDGGHTWENTPHPAPRIGHAGPTVLSDGSLIVISMDFVAPDERHSVAHISTDVGESWRPAGEIPVPDEIVEVDRKLLMTEESHILELQPGHLMVFLRAHGRSVHMYQSYSKDNGKSWTEVRELPFAGLPPHLIRLQSGAILCSYGHRQDPWTIRAVLSHDDGQTWDTDNIITLDHWQDQPDMGYPASLEVSPGEIATVYYISRAPITHRPLEEKAYKIGSSPEGILYTRYALSD